MSLKQQSLKNVFELPEPFFYFCLWKGQNHKIITSEMTFLDKFKGKTNFLSKEDVSGVLGKIRTHANANSIQTSATFSPQPRKSNTVHYATQKDGPKTEEGSPGMKKNKISPFHVMNPFYLDELERERDERQKHQRQIKERMEKQRKKREELQAKLAESGKVIKQKLQIKEWKPMGGLGPNVGGDEWLKKTELHNKMMKFSQDINKVNLQKVKCMPFMSLSHLHNSGMKHDSRSVAIEYSRKVPRPKIMAAENIIAGLPRSESRDQISEMEKLDNNHLKYMELMKKM